MHTTATSAVALLRLVGRLGSGDGFKQGEPVN
jgi:hypothetical protein